MSLRIKKKYVQSRLQRGDVTQHSSSKDRHQQASPSVPTLVTEHTESFRKNRLSLPYLNRNQDYQVFFNKLTSPKSKAESPLSKLNKSVLKNEALHFSSSSNSHIHLH